jgi:hypothetical protein
MLGVMSDGGAGAKDDPNAAGALAPSAALPLASGRRVEVVEGREADTIVVRAPSGECVLSIRVTDAGPVLSFRAAALELAAGSLALGCDDLRIVARQSAAIEVGGDLRERVGGSVHRDAAGTSTTSAREVALQASPGGVVVDANDDVTIRGERVRLNSDDPPMPLSWDEARERAASRRTHHELGGPVAGAARIAEHAVWVGPEELAPRDDARSSSGNPRSEDEAGTD